jgi:uncharacterized protein with PQ loop repeat
VSDWRRQGKQKATEEGTVWLLLRLPVSEQQQQQAAERRRHKRKQTKMTDATAALAAASTAAVAASSDAAVVAPLVQSAVSAASASTSLLVQVSQALGLLVSGGSALVKLPQLVSLLRSRSTRGVSLEMYVLELLAQSVAVLYHRLHGFPVATYGENLTLGAGNVAILLAFVALGDEAKTSDGSSNNDGSSSTSSSSLISSFSRSTRLRALAALALPVALLPLLRFPALLSLLQSLSIPMNIAAKLPQIRINQRLIDQLTAQRDRLLRARWAAKLSANASGSSGSNSNLSTSAAPSGSFPPTGATSGVARTLPTPAGMHLAPVPGAAALAAAATSGASSFASSRIASSPSAAAPASSLSSVPFVLNLLGSVSRLYTTMAQLAGDRVLLLSFGVSIALNAAIIVQCRRMEFLQRQCETAALELERQLQLQQQQQQQQQQPPAAAAAAAAAAGSENGDSAGTAVSR